MTFRKFLAPIALVRIVLILAALVAAVAGFAASRRASRAGLAEGKASYACPMHPEVISATPGDCPICRMALEPMKARTEAASPANPSESAGDRVRSFSVPARAEFRAFDAISRTKNYPLSLEMRAPASAADDRTGTALYYLDESELLEGNEEGLFSPTGRETPGSPQGVPVRVSEKPAVRWDRRTALVEFRARPGGLVAGETGSVKFAARIRRGLVVRASAIVESEDGPHVFVTSDDRRTLVRRAVDVGNVIFGYAAIVGGLRENENVVSRYTYLLDVERRFLEVAP